MTESVLMCNYIINIYEKSKIEEKGSEFMQEEKRKSQFRKSLTKGDNILEELIQN